MLRWLKSWFGKYEPGYEYWICVDEIKITPEFAKTQINPLKYSRKNNYFNKTGKFESPIILKRDFTLVDGYSTYKICKDYCIDKIGVYFVD